MMNRSLIPMAWLLCLTVVLEGIGTLRNPVAAEAPANDVFEFRDQPGKHLDIVLGERPVLRFINQPRDGSSPDSHYMTFKPFHHVFDPTSGKVLLTSGVHPNTKDFRYPHHRGLFFGFNRISYGDRTADIWHGRDHVYSTCHEITETTADARQAAHTAEIGWYGKEGDLFATEQRRVVVYNVSGGTKIDWSTRLTTELDLVRLDGDPQHAGFHFRANQQVAMRTADQTYYLRPDGKGGLGETRNWAAKQPDPQAIDLPWNAMSFVLDDQRYTVLRINHPDNPGEKRGSERDYGRFGDYFEYDLTPDHPLELKYRIWIQEGEMTVDQCARKAAEFLAQK